MKLLGSKSIANEFKQYYILLTGPREHKRPLRIKLIPSEVRFTRSSLPPLRPALTFQISSPAQLLLVFFSHCNNAT